jgi:acetyl esterase/lipase
VLVAIVVAVLSAIGPVPEAKADGVRYRDLVFAGYTTTPDLVYGRSVDYAGATQDHLLDVLQPAGDTAESRAAVVWVHGGYFIEGSKDVSWYQDAREQYVKAGYVVFSINYRLNPTLPRGLLPTLQTLRLQEYIQEAKDAAHDAQAAVRWVRAHAAEYKVDPNKIAISGHSAGGIISQMVAWNSEEPGDTIDPNSAATSSVSSRVNAAVASAGGSLPIVLTHVSTNEPPVFLSHGLLDDVVPYPAELPSCVVAVALLNVCEQQLKLDQPHQQFGFEGWRDFLYRRMINPPALDLPVQVHLYGVGSLLGL